MLGIKVLFLVIKDYLSFIEEWGTEEQKEETTKIIKKWSKESKYWGASYWIKRYLYYVRGGNKDDLFEAKKESAKWVEKNPYDITLRLRSFYSEMLLSNSFQARQNILTKIVQFLDDENVKNLSNSGEIFAFYLSSVSWGSKKQKKDAIRRAKEWLEKNPGYNANIQKVRKRFLNFVSEWGTQKDREEIFQENSRWLEIYPNAIKVKIASIYLSSWMREDFKANFLHEVQQFLYMSNTKKDMKWRLQRKILASYLYLASHSTSEQKRKAFECAIQMDKKKKFSKVISKSYIRASEALLIYYLGKPSVKKRCLCVIEKSLKTNPDNLRLRVVYLLIIASFKKRDRNLYQIKTEDALATCREWSQESWVSSDFWFAYLRLHDTFGMVSDQTMEIVGKWIEENPEYVHANVKQYYNIIIHKRA